MWFWRGRFGDQFKQDFRPNLEAACELHDSVEFDVGFPPLDSSDVIAMNGTHSRELLLRETPFITQNPYLFAEQILCAGHAV